MVTLDQKECANQHLSYQYTKLGFFSFFG